MKSSATKTVRGFAGHFPTLVFRVTYHLVPPIERRGGKMVFGKLPEIQTNDPVARSSSDRRQSDLDLYMRAKIQIISMRLNNWSPGGAKKMIALSWHNGWKTTHGAFALCYGATRPASN
jgi:hypothetical protein